MENAKGISPRTRISLLIVVLAIAVSLLFLAFGRNEGYFQDLTKDLGAGIAVFALLHVALVKNLHGKKWFAPTVLLSATVILLLGVLPSNRFWQSVVITIGVSLILFAALEKYVTILLGNPYILEDKLPRSFGIVLAGLNTWTGFTRESPNLPIQGNAGRT